MRYIIYFYYLAKHEPSFLIEIINQIQGDFAFSNTFPANKWLSRQLGVTIRSFTGIPIFRKFFIQQERFQMW